MTRPPQERRANASTARSDVEPAVGGDPLAALLSLAEASELCGLAAHTLTQQAKRGRLRARLVGHTWVTTREALADYLARHARTRPVVSGDSRAECRVHIRGWSLSAGYPRRR